MERLTPHEDETVPAKVREPGKLQRWVRAALVATLAVVCGGDSYPPPHHRHLDITENSAPRNAVPPRIDGLPGTFSEEQEKDPTLTENGYIDLLVRSLDTPEKLGRYLRTRIEYVQDPKGENYWQTPEETIQRGEGDCEDYALLAQRILQSQGKNAHVVSNFQDHASCVWIRKRANGKYDGYNFDDAGVDKNGELKELLQRPLGDTSPLMLEGHDTVLDALNAALSSHNEKGYSVPPYYIPVHRLRHFGIKHYDYLTIHAFDPDLPCIARISNIELTALATLLGMAYGTHRFLRRRREGIRGTWKEYFTTFRLH